MSAEFRKSLIYHEYGHAIFDIHGINESKELKSFMRKWNGIWNEKYNRFSPDSVTKGLALDNELRHKYYISRVPDNEMTQDNWSAVSKIWKTMDTVQAISTYKYGCIDIDGHAKSYWNLGAYYRRTELYAHICENMFAGNTYMRDILGKDFYEEMTALFNKITP